MSLEEINIFEVATDAAIKDAKAKKRANKPTEDSSQQVDMAQTIDEAGMQRLLTAIGQQQPASQQQVIASQNQQATILQNLQHKVQNQLAFQQNALPANKILHAIFTAIC